LRHAPIPAFPRRRGKEARIVGAFLALLLHAVVSHATGLAFLKVCPESAAAGMGEGAAGGWQNALSPVDNPALAPPDERWQAAVTHSRWIFDTDYTALGFQMPARGWSLGADLRVLSIPDIELRDDANPDPDGYYRVDDLAFGLRASAPLGKGLRGGAALRRVQEKINQEASQGWIADLGLRWERPLQGAGSVPSSLALAMTARNLGYSSDFIDEAPEPPRTLSLGGEWRGRLPLAGWECGAQAELRHLKDDGAHLHLGLETLPAAGLALRGGWLGGYDNRGATLGLGFAWRALRLDYAWLPFANGWADVHRFTFSFAM